MVSSTLIRLEDAKKKDKEMIRLYFKRLHGMKKIGHMVYNLFRSGIIEKEIIPHLKKTNDTYKHMIR